MRHIALALFAISLAACSMGDAPGAVDVSTLGPMSGREQALMTTGQAAASRNEFAQAEQSYMNAVAASKGHVDAHLALADLYLKQNQPAKARDVLERAAIFQPGHVAVNYSLGKLYLNENRPADALRVFERGLDTQPQSLDLLSGKGIAHDMLRQHAAAQVAYLRALSLNPDADLAPVRTNLAMSYLLDNKPDKAAELLKTEALAEGASPVTRHNLALAYGMLGRHTEAKELVAGEMSEEERQASLKRLAQYIAGRDDSGKAVLAPVAPVPVRQAN